MHKIMRATMALGITILTTLMGLMVGEPVLGLLGLFSAVLYLKADWNR